MRKSDKKIDNQIRAILTELCESYFESIEGFKWLTHIVNYSNFPNSFKVICIFEQKNDIEQFLLLTSTANVNKNKVLTILNNKLVSAGIKITKFDKLMKFDDEQSCLAEHNGNWANRLAARY